MIVEMTKAKLLNNGFVLIFDNFDNFKYPKKFLQYINTDDIDEIPSYSRYYFLGTDQEIIIFWHNIIKEQYPKRLLVPFAKDEGSDDVFCFDGTDTSGNPKVYQVHTYASEGWEDRGYWDNFDEWYDEIKQISDEYKKEMEEDE